MNATIAVTDNYIVAINKSSSIAWSSTPSATENPIVGTLSAVENPDTASARTQWAFSSHTVVNMLDTLVMHESIQIVSTADDWFLFQMLKKQWYKEKGITSLAVKMALCPSYQKIIGMGPSVVPFILRELKNKGNDPEHWFWALEMITREDPIPVSSYGNTVEMARAWLSWAENQNGLAVGGQVSFRH